METKEIKKLIEDIEILKNNKDFIISVLSFFEIEHLELRQFHSGEYLNEFLSELPPKQKNIPIDTYIIEPKIILCTDLNYPIELVIKISHDKYLISSGRTKHIKGKI